MTVAEFEAALKARGAIACNMKLHAAGAAVMVRRHGETDWSEVAHGRTLSEAAGRLLGIVPSSDIADLI